MHTSNAPLSIKYMRLPQVLASFPVSKSSWWNGVKAGIYPKPYKLSPNCTAWLASDIEALLLQVKQQQENKA